MLPGSAAVIGEQRLWLIRHAPVAGTRGIIHAPDAPADLSDEAASAALRGVLPAQGCRVASPTRRTMETAAAIGAGFTPDPAFREQNFGEWTGRTHAALAAADPEGYRLFWRAAAENRPPGGESFADQVGRCREGLGRWHQAADLVLVTHSGTVRALLCLALGVAPARVLGFVVDPWSLTRIDRIGAEWRIVAVNLPPGAVPASAIPRP